MDSKHRHELEQNELARWITSQYEDWIRPNRGWLGYAVLGVLAVVAIIMATKQADTWNQAAAWKQFYAALNSEQSEIELELIADSTSGVVGVHARLALAEQQLTQGCMQVFNDKKKAVTHLVKAVDSFQRVQKATNDPYMLQRAGFGLGQCWEALSAVQVGDDLAKAKEEYQKVADRWGDEFWGQRAKKQLTLLLQPGTKKFIELAAAREEAASGANDFNVSIDSSDPYALVPGQVNLDMFGREETKTDDQKTDNDVEQPKTETEE
jgi:hypothetical protein